MSTVKQEKNLELPAYYNNRELSWLAFNKRVLGEAGDETNPLLERLRFLAIFSSNLDEFFMVRVAGLKDQVKANFNRPDNKSGLTPKKQLSQISAFNHELIEQQYQLFDTLVPLLKAEDIHLIGMDDLSIEQINQLELYFDEQIFPILTPMAIDAYRAFPMLLNKSINLAVQLDHLYGDDPVKTAIVQVPAILDRFIQVGSSHQYILLEDLIRHFIHKFFKGYQIRTATTFRITRNADMEIHEEGARDLLKEIEKELKKRKWGAAVRLEVDEREYAQGMVDFLLRVLEIHEKDLYLINGPLDLTFLQDFYGHVKKDYEHLLYETLIPQPAQDIHEGENVFEAARKRDLFLHHPYESFEPIVDLVREAASDPEVLAIKQTLYRVSGDSPIIAGLKRAAENGKQVTVLVELKARFDEENNVQWAKELEKAGCHVIYGMISLKTHSKITLVVRKTAGGIERVVHLGTGNYNDQTAKFYTDMSYITTKRKFGIDATNFFNYLSGYTEKPTFHHLSMAPFDIRSDITSYVDKEINHHKRYGNGRIIAKMNSLTDKVLIKKFYEASQAGVKVDLIIRGICCLRPGIPGISDNIQVNSIVGRFLEHTRIYYFHHNGEEKIFLSSADLMTRNMVKRVELMFPIFEGKLKSRIIGNLEIILNDTAKKRIQGSDGRYTHVKHQADKPLLDSQLTLFDMAYHVLEDEE
ncbi:RNA degradosome polyphosphate kinase [Gracilibacillus sp. S3-1-1]|uniref:RNA degradosome polyphosphate kinase n=1 Tax=Gracilibacillus pellucidus TaxID=3095368 RepID=A0ACC6M7I4_9BACI|nr:RNA degradosome polyphosphate kinase [Gracilibacillus sp. S3-1-1]MDX8046904.1 RNA degradosome polyphosphate kinase [Gracilibacillus sp. S3-1-1]